MSPWLLALFLAIVLFSMNTYTARLPNPSLTPFTSGSSRKADLSLLEAHSGNKTSPSLNFIGVDCYHLDPHRDLVTRQTCQLLFDSLISHGQVYQVKSWYNNFRFYSRNNECTIKIYSPTKRDRYSRINLSLSQIMLYAIEVLDSCKDSGTGGANVIQGDWRVAISRDVLKDVVAPT